MTLVLLLSLSVHGLSLSTLATPVTFDEVPSWLQPLAAPFLEVGQDLDALEIFAGSSELTKALAAHGFAVEAVDAMHDGRAESNILSFRGLMNCVQLLMRVRSGGLLWMAPPCASWIFISSSWHQRGPENGYRGNRRWRDVREATAIAVILSAFVMLAAVRNVFFVIEQPASSVLFNYLPLRLALQRVTAGSISTHLKSFAHHFPICKPLRLASTCPWVPHLARRKPPGISEVDQEIYTRSALGQAITGGPLLSSTAAYPPEFARVVPHLHI
jgi:hypothetical protein